jgi:DNA-directed RNA polymerase omega subunit
MKNIDTTAGLTSQAAVEAVGNRYDLVLIAALRVRELRAGARSVVAGGHNPTVTALLEIEQKAVGREYLRRVGNRPVRSSHN